MVCDRCFRPDDIGEHGVGLCPYEARRFAPVVRPDDIPGGVEFAHGICHANGKPKRYYSRSAIKLACEVKGIVPYHDVYAEQGNRVLSDARHRDDYLKSGTAQREKRWRDEARAERRFEQAREAARR